MSRRVFSCVICGWVIHDQDLGSVSWMNQFRGLYSGPEGVVLTGVGLYTDPRRTAYTAPPDPSARWDDPDLGYEHPREDQFGVMTQGKIRGRCGVILHDACWLLLRHAFHPAPVPHLRLFDVCDSLPNAEGDRGRCSKNWGHDYGGLAIIRDAQHFPWEARLTDRPFPDGWSDTPYSQDPMRLAIAKPGEVTADPPPRTAPPSSTDNSAILRPGHDPFNALPVELCSAIAAYLPTADALAARLASRSFWHLFDSQQFWASRFRGRNMDRSWLFEERALKGPRDWRWLYRRTTDHHLGEGVRNRKRIWGLVQAMVALLELRWDGPPASALPAPWQPLPSEDSLEWVLAAGNMEQESVVFSQLEKGCRRFWSARVAVPAGRISQVSASTVRLGNLTYIVGLSLSTAAGEVAWLGYKGASERSVPLSGLWGFNVAVGLGGIHALECIDGATGGPMAWLGCPEDAPQTERLAVGGTVTALKVGFDGFRMVSIAVAQPRHTPTRALGHDTLRRSAIWYPDVPPPAVCVNDDFFLPLEAYTRGYRPLFQARFGGPGGMYLQNLTRVTLSFWEGLRRVDFSFDREVPAECRSFGRREDPKYARVEFPIDGPGGEVIDSVVIHQQYPDGGVYAPAWIHEEGQLCRLKICTNRGRTCEVGGILNPRSKTTVRRAFSAAPGIAITGFFGAQYRNPLTPGDQASAITALGVISEPVRNEPARNMKTGGPRSLRPRVPGQ